MKDKCLTPRDPTSVAAVYVRGACHQKQCLDNPKVRINLGQRSVIFDGV